MKRVSVAVRTKAKKIKLLLLDVDGVLTDGRIIIDNQGVETKHFDVHDGQGISLLKRFGVEVGFLTSRMSRIVQYRAQELAVELCYQGIDDKAGVYEKIKGESGLKDDQIAYMGDDIIDLPILRQAGLAISVHGGWSGLMPLVDYVTEASGGRGAVREIAELLLRAQGKWTDVMRRYSGA